MPVKDLAFALRTLRSLEGQVHAMADVHWTLKRTGKESDVEMQSYLLELVDNLRQAYVSDGRDVRSEVNAGNIQADHRLGTRVGAIVAELVGNSLVHALRGERPLQLLVRLSEHTSGGLELVVQDDGPGMPTPSGGWVPQLGLTVVRLLVDEMGGRSQCLNCNGLKWQIVLPARKVGEAWEQ